jgi:hypothetical protein
MRIIYCTLFNQIRYYFYTSEFFYGKRCFNEVKIQQNKFI